MPVFLRYLLNLGPTNPVAVRIVANGSRRTRHNLIRSIYLGVLILVLLWTLLAGQTNSSSFNELAKLGAESFTSVAYLQIVLICVLAPVFMAGAIAQEADPKTWEVLLTTPLSDVQIVLGNLFGRLFFILALLAASMPLFSLTQYFGGMPGSAIFGSYLIAGSAATLVGAIAIAMAVSRMAGKRSVFAFYVSVITYIAVTAGVDVFLRSRGSGMGPKGAGVTWMTAINPFLALRALLNPTNYPTADPTAFTGLKASFLAFPVRTWCVGTLMISGVLMLASTLTVRTGGLGALTQEAAGIPWYRRLFGLGAAGADHRAPRAVWQNPIAWREAAARNATLTKQIARWAFVIAGGLFGTALLIFYRTGLLKPADFQLALLVTCLGQIAVITLVAINLAAVAVSREREDGTLDLLLTTPITASAYLTGKLRGLLAYLLPMIAVPLFTLALAGIYTLVTGDSVQATSTGPTVPIVLPEAALLMPLVAVPFAAFCVMVGMQMSVKSRGTLGAVVSTVAVVGISSGIVGLCAYNSGKSISTIGPVITALSPGTLLYSLVEPADAVTPTLTASGGLATVRVGLVIGSLISAGVYSAIVYGIHANMVRTFDQTVRKLAGVK